MIVASWANVAEIRGITETQLEFDREQIRSL
jgi:hypothetical protein